MPRTADLSMRSDTGLKKGVFARWQQTAPTIVACTCVPGQEPVWKSQSCCGHKFASCLCSLATSRRVQAMFARCEKGFFCLSSNRALGTSVRSLESHHAASDGWGERTSGCYRVFGLTEAVMMTQGCKESDHSIITRSHTGACQHMRARWSRGRAASCTGRRGAIRGRTSADRGSGLRLDHAAVPGAESALATILSSAEGLVGLEALGEPDLHVLEQRLPGLLDVRASDLVSTLAADEAVLHESDFDSETLSR